VSFHDTEETITMPIDRVSHSENIRETLEKIDISCDTRDAVSAMEELQGVGPVVGAATLQAHLAIVAEECTAGAATPDEIMSAVPFLLLASNGYLRKSLAFSEKIEWDQHTSSGVGSLVEQLAKLRQHFRHTKENRL
jgi:hypothetical protein